MMHKSLAPGFHSRTEGFDETPHDDSEIIEEDELAHLKQMKDLKRDYRVQFKELKEIKSSITYT